MANMAKKDETKKENDLSDIIVIDEKKKHEDFDLGRDDLDALGEDDDELDLDGDYEFDDGGD